MKKHLPLLIGLFCMFSCCAGVHCASGQDEQSTVTCPPNSHWTGQGTECSCDSGFVVPRGENSCVPESQACRQYGPSHLVGNDCVCNEGYAVAAGGSRCEPVTVTCPPNSHPQGADCICNEGYGNIDGKCVSLAAACAKYNARWSPAKGDCECPPGLHEDKGANKCVADAPEPRQAAVPIPNPVQAEPRVPTRAQGSDLASGHQPETGTPGGPAPARTDRSRETATPPPENKVSADPAPAPEKTPAPVPAGGDAKGPETAGWWGTSGQEPAPGSEPPLPKSVNPKTADEAAGREEQPARPDAGAFRHQTEAQPPSASEEQAQGKMAFPQQPPGEQEKLAPDVYQNSGATDSPVLEKAMAQSLYEASPEKKQEMEEQLRTLSGFTAPGAQEVFLENKGLIESAKEQYLEQEHISELLQWHQDIKEAEASGKVKEGVDKGAYLAKAEDEKRLKSQIAEIEKTIGFNHLRLVEAAGVQKYETMPADYRAHFTKSADDDFNAASEGIESEKAFRNIAAMSGQARDLKKQLKEKYPRGWQNNYLDLPEAPRIDALRKKVDGNIFVLFEKRDPRDK